MPKQQTTQAAVLVEANSPLVIAQLEIPELAPGQVLVKLAFSGVCHTQVMECKGMRGPDAYIPHCMGHEGSGVVQEVGSEVTKVKPGDKVILSWIQGSGANVPGSVYKWSDKTVNAGSLTTFSQHSVVSENRVTLLPDGISMKQAAMVGCAVPTGVGSVLNTGQAKAGQSLVVFGAGGIGLFALAGAAIAGCSLIIAVDIRPEKLELSKQMGSTHQIISTDGDAIEQINAICPGGVDISVEATGRPEVMMQALQSVRNQGGIAVVVGNAPFGEMANLDPKQLNLGKQIRGTWGGDSVPDRDYPKYCEFIRSEKLSLEPMMSTPYSLNKINDAIEDLVGGRTARPIIDMESE